MAPGLILAFGCPIVSWNSWQVGLFWRSEKPEATSCCPIGFQKAAEIQLHPQRRAQQGKESSEAMAPFAYPSAEAQEHIGQERRPYLPAYCIGVVSQEVGQLQRLFDLLEEYLDLPATPIQIDDGLCAPFQVIRQKRHFPQLPVHFHHGDDPPQPRRIEPTRSRGFHLHHVVAQNIADASPLIPPDHPKLHPLLSARHPGYPALEQLEEVEQIQIGFVENHDLPGQQARAQLPSLLGVAVTRRVHDSKSWQKTLQVQPQMTFGRRLAPSMLGPVHAVGHQLNGGRIHEVDHPLETKGKSGPPPAAEAGTQTL